MWGPFETFRWGSFETFWFNRYFWDFFQVLLKLFDSLLEPWKFLKFTWFKTPPRECSLIAPTFYMMLKVDFQKLSEIEIFRKSKDFGLISTWIIIMCPWCYIWCWKQHSITVAGFQQNCCFSATNVDFSGFCTFIQVKIEIWMKKQHLLPKNNTFVENQQQWCYVVLHIIYRTFSSKTALAIVLFWSKQHCWIQS